jgi:hypothetical protein
MQPAVFLINRQETTKWTAFNYCISHTHFLIGSDNCEFQVAVHSGELRGNTCLHAVTLLIPTLKRRVRKHCARKYGAKQVDGNVGAVPNYNKRYRDI